MTSRDFCYWLQGAFELNSFEAFTAEQTDMIRRHLALVFLHEIDPQAGGPEVQEKLNEVHKPKQSYPGHNPIWKASGMSSGTVFRC